MAVTQNPAPTTASPSGVERVQPDSPLSGEVKRGGARPGRPSIPMADRLAAGLEFDHATGCHNWTGALVHGGYGQLRRDGPEKKAIRAHRLAYELAKGPIPDGLHIDHLCRNPRCCNADHLEAVTSRENTLRGFSPAAVAARRQTCAAGHAYVGGSFQWSIQRGRPVRRCIVCERRKTSARRRNRKVPFRPRKPRLTDAQVMLLRSSCEPLEAAAERLGVSRVTARDARNGRTYIHLPMPIA